MLPTSHHFCTQYVRHRLRRWLCSPHYLQILAQTSICSHWFFFRWLPIFLSLLGLVVWHLRFPIQHHLFQFQQHLFTVSQRQLPHLQFHFLLSLCDSSNVVNATAYKQRLAVQHIGPDIFSEIDNKMLTTEIGIPTGDIICLKKGSTVWWNGPDAKQKCSNTDWSSTSHLKSLTHCPQKRLHMRRNIMVVEPAAHRTSNDCWWWWWTKGLQYPVSVCRTRCLAPGSKGIHCLWGWQWGFLLPVISQSLYSFCHCNTSLSFHFISSCFVSFHSWICCNDHWIFITIEIYNMLQQIVHLWLHNITWWSKIPFSLIRCSIMTCISNCGHWEIIRVALKVWLECWESLFNQIIIRRVGREVNKLANYQQLV